MGPHFAHAVPVLGIIIIGGIVAIATIGAILILIIKTLKGNGSAADRQKQADEAMMIQEIYQGLSKMEERVEALETIILETSRKDSQR